MTDGGQHDRPHQTGGPGYEVYAAYIERTLIAQDARKSSIEQRGISVITTSGTLVTLLFAVIGLATKASTTYNLPADIRGWLVAAVTLLVLAAAGGLVSNIPLQYSNVKVTELRQAVDTLWNEDAWTATGRVARTQLEVLERATAVNRLKVYVLFAAVICEVGALIPLAVAVVRIAG